MFPPLREILVTGAAALLFAAMFLVGDRLNPLRALVRDRRGAISFGAGMSAAYVFVHVMPELHSARGAFAASASIPLRYEGMAIYFLALVGFLVFYGLDHLLARLRETGDPGGDRTALRLHVGGFAAYVGLMAYLLVDSLERTTGSTALYTLAISTHFLSLDHHLREEHGAAYDRAGRFLLAGMSVSGWLVGVLLPLPRGVLALLVAFISGAIIMNNSIMELPSGKDGRFLPFMAGGLLYGLLLLPLG
jgi:hypothetical protein